MKKIIFILLLLSCQAHAYTPLIDCAGDGSHALTSTKSTQSYACTIITGGAGSVTIGTSLTAANPQVSGHANSGLYSSGTDVETIIGGTPIESINSTGVSIGTTSTIFSLQVQGNGVYTGYTGTNGAIALQNATIPAKLMYEGFDPNLGTVGGGYIQSVFAGTAYEPTFLSPAGGGVAIGGTTIASGAALDLGSNTSSLLLPIGTTGTRPGTGVNGMVRYNTDTPAIEGYINNTWSALALASNAGVSSFSGDGALLSNSLSTGAVTATLANAAANTVWGNNTASPVAGSYQTSINVSGTVADTGETVTGATGGTAYTVSGVTTGTGLSVVTLSSGKAISVTATTSGIGLLFNSTPASMTTAAALSVAGTATQTADYTGCFICVKPVRTMTAAATRIHSGQMELLDPSYTITGTLASIMNVSGDTAQFTRVLSNTSSSASSSINVTGAILNLINPLPTRTSPVVDTAPVLIVNQQDTSGSGPVISILNSGTGPSIASPAGVTIGSTSVPAGVALDLGSNITSMLLPVGTTGDRPATGINGMLRYNSTNSNLEAYQNNAWTALSVTAGTVTSVATTSPITGGTFTTTGTIACATCVTSAASLTSGKIIIGQGSQATAVDANAALSAGALTLGASGTAGSVAMGNATSGTVTLQPVTGALGGVTASLPANTGTIAETNLVQTFSAAQTFSSTITPSTTSGIVGTTGADSAQAGSVGEYIATGCPKTSETATITIASPAVITMTAHGIVSNNGTATNNGGICPVVFTNSGGALPTGIVSGTVYYSIGSTVTANTFQIATSIANAIAGTAVNTSGSQSGTQTGTIHVPLSNGVTANVSAINLTAGDWDVCGNYYTDVGASTVRTRLDGSISTSSANFPSNPDFSFNSWVGSVTQTNQGLALPCQRFNVSSATPIYAVVNSSFTAGTDAVSGNLWARRRR